MTDRTIPITAVQEMVARPIAIAVVRDVMRMFNIGTLNGQPSSQLIFNLNGNQTSLPQSTLNHQESSLRLPGDIKIELSLQETPTEHAALIMTHAAETRYVFADIENRVYVKPIYTPIESVMRIKISGQSRSQVQDIHRMLMITVQQQGRFLRHECAYNYIVPRYVILSLINIHQLREANGGYGESLGQYLKSKFTESMTPIVDSAGGQANFTIAETGILINGNFNYQETPVPERADSIGEYTIEFEYRYFYERPDFMHISHPVTIHNQLMDQRFLELNTLISPEQYNAQYGQLQSAFGSTRLPPNPVDFFYRQPYFDDWKIGYKPKNFDVLISYLAGVEDQSTRLLNLLDVEHFSIKSAMLNYIKDAYGLMTQNNQSLLVFRVYHWYNIMDSNRYAIDADLNVDTDFTLNVRDQYHGIVAANTSFDLINPEHDAMLIKHGCFFKAYLTAYYPQVAHLLKVNPDCTADPSSFILTVDRIRYDAKVPVTVNRLRILPSIIGAPV